MRFRGIYSIAILSVLLIGCSEAADGPIQPLTTPSAQSFDAHPNVPPRDTVGNRWVRMVDQELWDYIVTHDTTVVVGLKAPGAQRGIWRGEILMTAGQLADAREQVQAVSGVEILREGVTLPVLEVRLASEDQLSALRALPVADYVEPAVMELVFADKGCGYPAFRDHTVSGTTFAGDLMPEKFTRPGVRIPNAWIRSAGENVVVGSVDTGISYYQNHLNQGFASGYSAGRLYDHHSVLAGSGSQPAWHDQCGHGTRMAGVSVAPMNGQNIAGVAWRSDLLSVRFSDGVVMPRTLSTADAIMIAAGHPLPGWDPHHRRIVVMAWGTESSYTPVRDQILMRYEQGTLFIGASGTSGWVPSWFLGVVWPARMDEVVAVSAVRDDGSQHDAIHYGPEVELAFFIHQPTTGFLTQDSVNMGGSSGATAVVGGIAALVWSQYPNASRDWVRNRLQWAGHNFPNRTNTAGYGVVNAWKAVGGMYGAHIDAPFWVNPGSTFTVTANPEGGNGPFTYLWDNGATTQSTTYTAGPEGTTVLYSVHVTDTYDGHSLWRAGESHVEDRSECEDPTMVIC